MSDYVQLPSDSIGKKIRHIFRKDVTITAVSANIVDLDKGDTVTGDTSGVTAIFMGQQTELGATVIYLQNPSGDFTIGETLSTSEYAAFGTVSSQLSVYTPTVVVTDPDTPFNRQKIDHLGSAQIKFREGDMSFDAFGHSQTVHGNIVASIVHTYGDLNAATSWNQSAGGGSITANTTESLLRLSVDNASGSLYSRTTNQYYPYTPGAGSEVIMTSFCGDSGKVGNIRRWGQFDDNDGMYFMLSGSGLYVGIRSSTSGTPTDTIVAQGDFNGDTLESASVNAFQLNVTKANVYWWDYAWLGAGRVRMGVYSPDGDRLTMHTFENSNVNSAAYMRTGTLPLRYENINVAGTSGTSELNIICASVLQQGATFANYVGPVQTYNVTQKIVSGSTPIPLFSARSALTYNGVTNRATIVPLDFEVNVSGSPIRIDNYIATQLTGSTFSNTIGTAEIDDAANEQNGGVRRESLMFGTGVSLREFDTNFVNALQLGADGTSQPVFTVSAISMDPSGSATVDLTVRWKEIL